MVVTKWKTKYYTMCSALIQTSGKENRQSLGKMLGHCEQSRQLQTLDVWRDGGPFFVALIMLM